MSKIFESDDENDVNENFQTNNEYARNYSKWRNKEEQNRLKTKYGEDIEQNDSSSSSSDDEEGVELTPAFEKDFFKTLSLLKSKDPSIYDKNVHFFQETEKTASGEKPKKTKKEQPMYLKDYERKIILEKGGVLSDEEDEIVNENKPRSRTYVEEQQSIKEGFKKLLDDSDEEEEDGWGGILQQRKKTKEEAEKEEADYKSWLAGQQTQLDDKEVETELKPLKDYWNKPDLDDGEKFLRDYILKKRFLDTEQDDDYVPTYDEIVHDSDQDLSNDEENIEKQEEFEHKYNFRFEEPDQEFIKRYPRTLEGSLRMKDDRRKVKRQETKERKKKEKEEKMQELKKLQELKRQEIEEKLDKLKEITGNASLGFEDNYIDGDFDPEEHDRKMQALFNDEFYAVEEGEQKPQFPELDEELEIENWERYDAEKEDSGNQWDNENFNMDCDYDPQASAPDDTTESGKSRKRRKRKSRFAAALSKPKPKYDPSDKNYEKYFDEYYKLDCEDIVGDIPCRFKYRQVVPNDFGLSTEEILLANERELNKWCSLKKAVQIRPDHVEKYEQIAYKKKGQNINLKMKILPSLFSKEPENVTKENGIEISKEDKIDTTAVENNADKKEDDSNAALQVHKETVVNNENESSKKKRKKKVKKDENQVVDEVPIEGVVLQTKKKKKNKKKKTETQTEEVTQTKKNKPVSEDNFQIKTNKKRKRSDSEGVGKKSKTPKKMRSSNDVTNISDARLSAYGINPKKFKNKLKYGK
nr:protein KRI1 homolog [Leptinotarsa decemlineata]